MDHSQAQSRTDALLLLADWVQQRLSVEQFDWLQQRIDKSLKSNSGKELYITLGLIPRKLDHADLGLSESQLRSAEVARSGWDPSLWSIAGSARILVLTRLAQSRPDSFAEIFRDLCNTADVSESLEYYSALPLLPGSEGLDKQVGEGLRTNMRAVFEAIAHRNPYPMETFDENRWNHMVLKALFVGSTLAPIQGLDARANEQLAGILCDFAHERWAANRDVTCELWRCVGPFAKGAMIDDLARVFNEGDTAERSAAAIALHQSKDPAARNILASDKDLMAAVNDGMIAWQGEAALPVDNRPQSRMH